MKPMELLLIGIAVYFWYTCKQQSTSVAMTDANGNPIMQNCFGMGGNVYQWPVSMGPCPTA